MVKLFLFILPAILLLNSCKVIDPCDPDSLLNKREKDIGDCLQDSANYHEFYISHQSNLYEFQNGLYEKIDSLRDNDSLLIREFTVKHESSTTVVWLEKRKDAWIVFDALKYSGTTRF